MMRGKGGITWGSRLRVNGKCLILVHGSRFMVQGSKFNADDNDNDNLDDGRWLKKYKYCEGMQ